MGRASRARGRSVGGAQPLLPPPPRRTHRPAVSSCAAPEGAHRMERGGRGVRPPEAGRAARSSAPERWYASRDGARRERTATAARRVGDPIVEDIARARGGSSQRKGGARGERRFAAEQRRSARSDSAAPRPRPRRRRPGPARPGPTRVRDGRIEASRRKSTDNGPRLVPRRTPAERCLAADLTASGSTCRPVSVILSDSAHKKNAMTRPRPSTTAAARSSRRSSASTWTREPGLLARALQVQPLRALAGLDPQHHGGPDGRGLSRPAPHVGGPDPDRPGLPPLHRRAHAEPQRRRGRPGTGRLRPRVRGRRHHPSVPGRVAAALAALRARSVSSSPPTRSIRS